MRVAFDLQTSPPRASRPLPAPLRLVVVATYFFAFCLAAAIGILLDQKAHYAAVLIQAEEEVAAANQQDMAILAEATQVDRELAYSRELGEWLSLAPPAQRFLLVIARKVEPDILYTRVLCEMEPVAPNLRLTVEMSAASQDAAALQVSLIQEALTASGFATVNIESDQPISGGRRFVVMLALPRNGDFRELTDFSTNG